MGFVDSFAVAVVVLIIIVGVGVVVAGAVVFLSSQSVLLL